MKNFILSTLLIIPFFVFSQDDLLNELDNDSEVDNKVTSVFKALKVVNFESTKLVNKKDLYLYSDQQTLFYLILCLIPNPRIHFA